MAGNQDLPLGSMADVPLADAMRGGGCPLCILRRRAESTAIRSLLWENVNDRRMRDELDRAGGYCTRHTRAVLAASRKQSGPPIGAAILYQAILRRQLTALRAARSSGRRTRRAASAQPGVPVRCPICRDADEATRRAIEALLERLGDEAWVEALARAELCLGHLTSLWAAAGTTRDAGAWIRVADAQLERLESIRARLEAYAHHNSADRRHLLTLDERAAVGQAETLLSGDADREVSS